MTVVVANIMTVMLNSFIIFFLAPIRIPAFIMLPFLLNTQLLIAKIRKVERKTKETVSFFVETIFFGKKLGWRKLPTPLF